MTSRDSHPRLRPTWRVKGRAHVRRPDVDSSPVFLFYPCVATALDPKAQWGSILPDKVNLCFVWNLYNLDLIGLLNFN